MVYASGKSAPTYKHLTKEDAELEAKRLTEKLNVPCYVLEATDKVCRNIRIEVKEPTKIYYYQVTDDSSRNQAMFDKLREISGVRVPPGIEVSATKPGDLVYTKDDHYYVSEYAEKSYYAIRLVGIEIKSEYGEDLPF